MYVNDLYVLTLLSLNRFVSHTTYLKNMGPLPSGEAKRYGDRNFKGEEYDDDNDAVIDQTLSLHPTIELLFFVSCLGSKAMMYAKVLCVLYPLLLGYE